jgi:hypothetical protein
MTASGRSSSFGGSCSLYDSSTDARRVAMVNGRVPE